MGSPMRCVTLVTPTPTRYTCLIETKDPENDCDEVLDDEVLDCEPVPALGPLLADLERQERAAREEEDAEHTTHANVCMQKHG